MADPSHRFDAGDDSGEGGLRRWVRLAGIVAAVVILLLVVMMLTGGPGGHTTPPGAH